jgi:hypothetical protein
MEYFTASLCLKIWNQGTLKYSLFLIVHSESQGDTKLVSRAQRVIRIWGIYATLEVTIVSQLRTASAITYVPRYEACCSSAFVTLTSPFGAVISLGFTFIFPSAGKSYPITVTARSKA